MNRVPRWARRLVAALLFGLSFATPLHAGVTHDPAFSWQTLTTAHFKVHFHDGAEARAREAAAIAERVHERLSKVFHWTPEERTELVITDEYDVSNGYATFFPGNRTTIFLAAPDGINSLEDHNGWLETVITHEYVHILHLDKARGAPLVLRRIFGRVPLFFPTFFPNAFSPVWMIEGMATYYETDASQGHGRGQSSYFDMLMRMEVAGGGIKPLRQINQDVDTWPGGTVAYLYGVQFFNFARDRYGEDKIQKWVEGYSDNIVPYRITSNIKNTVGQDIDVAWNQFAQDRQTKYQAQIDAVRRQGEVSGQALSNHGWYAGPLQTAADGTAYYVVFDGKSDTALMTWKPGFKQPKHLTDVHAGARIDYHETAGILMAQPERCRNARYYYDLYRVNPKSGSTTRLTDCARYRHAAWHPDGKWIVAVHDELGQNSLDLLDENGIATARLWAGKNDDVIADVNVAPDGKSVVAAVWRRESGWNIELFSLETKTWRKLTVDAAIDMQPRFSRDGKSVYFISDHNGIFNLRRLALGDNSLTSLTNVVGGAFHPAQGPGDDEFYYIGYGSNGFDLHRVQVNPTALKAGPAAPSAVVAPKPPIDPNLKAESYSPWYGLRPRWWLPHLAIDSDRTELGVITSGSDVLGKHHYAIDAAYDFSNSLAVGYVSYLYDGWYPLLKLFAGRDNVYDRNDNGDITRIRSTDMELAEIILPWLRIDHRLSFHAALFKEKESDAHVEPGTPGLPDTVDNLWGTALVWNSTEHFPLSVSRSSGREVRLVHENSNVGSSDYIGDVNVLDWREFIPLWGENVLALRYVHGKGEVTTRPFRLGGTRPSDGSTGDAEYYLFAEPFNVREYPLRGYDDGLPALIGRNMQLASLEWRFPIKRIERGLMVPPMAIHQVHAAAFVESGGTWNDGSKPDQYRTGTGFEVFADMALGYFYRFNARLGVAYGLDDDGDTQVYLRIGNSF